jgi:hypothetical protein
MIPSNSIIIDSNGKIKLPPPLSTEPFSYASSTDIQRKHLPFDMSELRELAYVAHSAAKQQQAIYAKDKFISEKLNECKFKTEDHWVRRKKRVAIMVEEASIRRGEMNKWYVVSSETISTEWPNDSITMKVLGMISKYDPRCDIILIIKYEDGSMLVSTLYCKDETHLKTCR